MTPGGRSLEAKMRAWADNMFSRIIGFIVRVFVLLGAAIALLVISTVSVIEALMWPLVPVIIPLLIIMGGISWAN